MNQPSNEWWQAEGEKMHPTAASTIMEAVSILVGDEIYPDEPSGWAGDVTETVLDRTQHEGEWRRVWEAMWGNVSTTLDGRVLITLRAMIDNPEGKNTDHDVAIVISTVKRLEESQEGGRPLA
jgi:hypothetical protein